MLKTAVISLATTREIYEIIKIAGEDRRKRILSLFSDLFKSENENIQYIYDKSGQILSDWNDEDQSKIYEYLAEIKFQTDRNSIDLLRHLGVNPLGIIYLADLMSLGFKNLNAKIINGKCAGSNLSCKYILQTSTNHPYAYINAPIGSGAYSDDVKNIKIDRPMPNTVCISMMDRNLAEVVDHPVYNELDLKITNVKIERQETIIETNYVANKVYIQDMTIENFKPYDPGQKLVERQIRTAEKSHF